MPGKEAGLLPFTDGCQVTGAAIPDTLVGSCRRCGDGGDRQVAAAIEAASAEVLPLAAGLVGMEESKAEAGVIGLVGFGLPSDMDDFI